MFRSIRNEHQGHLREGPRRAQRAQISSVPGLPAARFHHLAHWLWTHDLRFSAASFPTFREPSRGSRSASSRGATIGDGFSIDHGMGW